MPSFKAQIEKGEAFDLAILDRVVGRRPHQERKLAAATRADIARSGVGVAVKKGAPKPDISTTEAFKRAMLDAKSIAIVEQGASGIYLKALFERMGHRRPDSSPRSSSCPRRNPAAHAVANGEAEIGMTQISEILPYAGAELVGPLPADIQLYTVFSRRVGSRAKEADGGQALIKFLTAPAAARGAQGEGTGAGLRPSKNGALYGLLWVRFHKTALYALVLGSFPQKAAPSG